MLDLNGLPLDDLFTALVEPADLRELFAAARRELIEETGLAGAEFPFGEVYVETDPYGRNKVARYYIGRVKHVPITLPVSAELGRPEHHEARWVTFEEGCGLLNDRVEAVLRANGQLCRIAHVIFLERDPPQSSATVS